MKLSKGVRYLYAGLLVGALGVSFWWWSHELPKATTTAVQWDAPYSYEVYWGQGEAVAKQPKLGLVDNLSEGKRIYSDSSIQTYENTHMSLVAKGLKDRIELGPTSQIYVISSEASRAVSLFEGEIFLSMQGSPKTPPLKVLLDGIEMKIENADVQIFARESRLVRAEVFRGLVNYSFEGRKSGSGKLEKDQILVPQKGKGYQVKAFDFQMITPFPNDRIYYPDGLKTRTRFAWSKVPERARVELLVGEQPDVLKEVMTERLTSKPNEFTALLDEGMHYWRIRAIEEGKKGSVLESPIQRILVLRENPVRLLEPQGLLSLREVSREKGVLFRWANPSRLERLLLEVSHEAAFEKPVVRQPLVDTGAQLVFVEGKGKFFWRINGFRHDSSELLSSRTGEFEIIDTVSDPQIVTPEPGSQISLSSIKNGTAWIQWRASGLFKYQVSISAKDTGTTVWQSTTAEAGVPFPDLKKGTYILKIVSVFEPEKASEREFEVISARGLEWKSRVSESMVQRASKIEWEKGPQGTSFYRVSLSSLFPTQKVAQGLKEYILSDAEWNTSQIEAGVYQVRVQALDQEKHVLAETDPLLFQTGKSSSKDESE